MRRPPTWTLALALMAAATARGDDPPKPAPALPVASLVASPPGPVAPGTLVTLDASATVGDDVDWDTDADQATYRVDSGKRFLDFSTPVPGKYPVKVMAFGLVDGRVRVSKAKVVIEVVGPAPAPVDPVVDPDKPRPPPVPAVAGHLNVTLFYDINDTSVTPLRARSLADALAALDCTYYTLATTAPAAQPFNAVIARDGSPVVVFQTADNRVVPGLSMKSPKSPAEVIARVQAIRGGAR